MGFGDPHFLYLCLERGMPSIDYIKRDYKKMRQMKMKLLFSVVMLFLLSSCMTMFGSKQTIKIDSYPQGARVYAKGVEIGVTPFTYTSKKVLSTFTLEKEGYFPTTFSTSTQLRPGILWNLLSPCWIGFLIDIPYWQEYDVDTYYIRLNTQPVNNAQVVGSMYR